MKTTRPNQNCLTSNPLLLFLPCDAGRAILHILDDIRISLPDMEKAFVDEQVAEGDFANASDYVAALIHAEAKAKAQEKLEALLLEGLEGEDIEWTPELMDEIREQARRPVP